MITTLTTKLRWADTHSSFDVYDFRRQSLVCEVLSFFGAYSITFFCWKIIQTDSESQLGDLFTGLYV